MSSSLPKLGEVCCCLWILTSTSFFCMLQSKPQALRII